MTMGFFAAKPKEDVIDKLKKRLVFRQNYAY